MCEERKQICVVTATRAEYGLLRPIIQKMANDRSFDVKVAVTGMHLSPEFGLTYHELEQDQIEIDKKIEILLSADTPSAISKSMGMAMIGFADYFSERSFDAILLLGDRFETLAVACAAANSGIPVIHMHGGEKTEGAVDDSFRHAITKLSYLHFTSTEEYRKRVIQLGESPERVFCVGAMGVENALKTTWIAPKVLSQELGIDLDKPYALITFHPVTLEKESAERQIEELLAALDSLRDWNLIVTKANADRDGRIINRRLEEYAASHMNMRVFDSLGMVRYLSLMKGCRMVIGNSSSGLIEAPSFCIPTVNIGDRQKGRIRAASVVDCEPQKREIVLAIEKADSELFRESLLQAKNPYGDGTTSNQILTIIKSVLCGQAINLKKQFYDLR